MVSFNGQWPIIRCTILYSKLKKQCKLNYRNKHHNSSLHMKQNSNLSTLCEMPLHHRHSAGLDSSHHIMQILCLTGITVQQWWLLHCYPRGYTAGYYTGIRTRGVLEITGGVWGWVLRAERAKNFFDTPLEGVFFAYEHPPAVFCSAV
mgnify:CR=1 FL=1